MTKACKSRLVLGHVICAVVVMAASLLVRLPSAYLAGVSTSARDAYTSEEGIPYLTDQDSYYHVRIVRNSLQHHMLGDIVLDDGTEWDMHSFYPRGRSAQYTPGIVWVTKAAWRMLHALFGTSLATVEFCFAPVMTCLVALAAYALGFRAQGRASGIVAAVLVACAPSFAARTVFGRFDTDVFVVLFDVLLALCMTEALRAKTTRSALARSCAFGISAAAYALCWAPQYALAIAAVVLAGGYVSTLLRSLLARKGSKETHRACAFGRPDVLAPLTCTALLAVVVLATGGLSAILATINSTMTHIGASNPSPSQALPNLYESISELLVPQVAPTNASQWLVESASGGRTSVMGGVGGAVAAALCVGGVAILVSRTLVRQSDCDQDTRAHAPNRHDCLAYLCVLGPLLVVDAYACSLGIRFVEHLAVPVGILAGIAAGWCVHTLRVKLRIADVFKQAIVAALCVAAAAPAMVMSRATCTSSVPTTSDASASGMQWIRKNAQDPMAPIASWWDSGYFYESESDHPCLWDGGRQDSVRAILVCKALVARDPQLSRSILIMLASSGNQAVELLQEHVSLQAAFQAITDALPLNKHKAQELLCSRYGLTHDQAVEVEKLLHPEEPKELYLVITNTMLRQLGWYEYYANWDFSGTSTTPAATSFDRMPDGTPLKLAPEGQALLEERAKETMWRLTVDPDSSDYFAPVFNMNDGVEHIRIWRVL